MSIGYLESAADRDPAVALQRAIVGFRQREGQMPEWVAAGEGVQLPSEEAARMGLSQRANGCRPGHILVGIGTTDPPAK